MGEPQCNGVIERFMRTLREQCLRLLRLTDLAHAEHGIGAFIEATTASGSWSVTTIARRARSGRSYGRRRD
jgi:hypothetical protein